MKKFLILSIIIFTIILLPHFSNAQGPDPGCDPLDPACPVDGGVLFLIAAGIGMGARKIRNQHSKFD